MNVCLRGRGDLLWGLWLHAHSQALKRSTNARFPCSSIIRIPVKPPHLLCEDQLFSPIVMEMYKQSESHSSDHFCLLLSNVWRKICYKQKWLYFVSSPSTNKKRETYCKESYKLFHASTSIPAQCFFRQTECPDNPCNTIYTTGKNVLKPCKFIFYYSSVTEHWKGKEKAQFSNFTPFIQN